MTKPLRTTIDPLRVRELRLQGYNFPAIGRLIANEEGRAVQYTPTIISIAFRISQGRYHLVENHKREKVYEQLPPIVGAEQQEQKCVV